MSLLIPQMNQSQFESLFIDYHSSILAAMKIMDKVGRKLLIVMQDEKFLSLISIGDIQRALLNEYSIDAEIVNILRKQVTVAGVDDSLDKIKKLMLESRSEYMPIVDIDRNIINVLFWEKLFGSGEKRQRNKINIPVIIMAGGKGNRLKPITNILPKPLIPIGEKTILENIMDQFVLSGCSVFYLSVNYKAEMIKYYFDTLKNKDYQISYFEENEPLGTAGSLFLLKDKISGTFFVSNCDIIIDADYSEILKYHMKSQNELTIVSALRHYPIPYGIIETGKNGSLRKLKEKPELTFQINSGMYLLEAHLLSEIPANQFFHITHLIEKVMLREGKIGVFPVSEGSWKDIGNWNEYLKEINIYG